MHDDDFEWDDAKAAANYAKHSVTFDAAREAFKDPFAISWFDGRYEYGEERSSLLGMVDGRVLFVAYTLRNGSVRTISARLAEPHEKRKYHEDNA
jgi:uncharacterized DUF497 family protein